MKSPRPNQQEQPEPLTAEQKLALAQQDQEKWRLMAENPNLSPKAAAWALDMASSAAAEVRLRQKGLAHQSQPGPLEQTDDQALAQLLGLNSSPQRQPNPSLTSSPNLSISPGTSA